MRQNKFNFIIFFIVIFVITFSAEGVVKMIRSNRIWVYNGFTMKYDDGEYYDLGARHFYRFGEQLTINNKEYTSFELYKTQYFKMKPFPDDNQIDSIYTVMRADSPKYYIREDESGSVYVLGEESEPNEIRITSVCDQDSEHNYVDCALYNFNAPDGSLMPGVGIDGNYIQGDLCAQYYNETIEIDGEACRQYDIAWANLDKEKDYNFKEHCINGFGFIEGIGITSNGCLADYEIFFEASFVGKNEFFPGQYSYLDGIFDENENPIFIFSTRLSKYLSEYKPSQNDLNLGESKVYDLYGRQITTPLPGTVYIRDGKKCISR